MPESIFDQQIKRKNTNCVKWDRSEVLYGKPNLLPMWIADMDFQAPDFILDALKNCVRQKVFGYTYCPESLYGVVQNWLMKRYGWEVRSDTIVFNHNVVSGVALALRVLTQKGDRVLIHNPVYNPFFEQINQLGRVPIVSELEIHDDRYYMDIADMERKIAEHHVSCILICSPHNPGGRLWTQAELRQLLDLAAKFDLPVIADEIHSDLVLPGKKHQPLAQLAGDQCARIVTLMAPTKTFNLAGIGPSYILAFDPDLAVKLQEEQKQMVYPEINVFQIAAMTAAYGQGEQWLNELMAYIKRNMDYVRACLSEVAGIRCMDNDATYLMWISYKGLNVTEDTLNAALVEQGVALQMGSLYGEAGRGFIRMNVATPRVLVIEGVNKMLKAFKQVKQAHAHIS
ncbi:pyridoxal phosphate-dependent aminotransferase [Sporolactobacillus sp. CPB3-1]|uniref:cysteine-S-conjugate beta-lyase n=1 Tax=Sporolactobacillus mangiferae TaxID=2940498 RepID=A0ABT0MBA3_9BACL|nr:pyridoxal phosphate-dependent aminotransferase [Sporolactobacillus mangiferae]